MKTPITVAILATISFSYTISSQAETKLHPIVTASRIAQTADQTLTAVTVITSEDIEQSQSQSVAEVLKDRVPGMDFLTTGGTGHQVSAFLRGTNSDHLLFMIDGNIIGSATTGAAALELIPVEQIERIEIIRGPRSSLYGSDAIGGVVQVFTKTGSNQQSASVTYGSRSTRAAIANINLNSHHTQLNFSANHFKTDGFNVTNDKEDDDDGFTNNAANINVKHGIDNNSNIHARIFQAEGETEFDNDSLDNVSESIQQSYSLGFDRSMSDQWNTSVGLGQSTDRLETDRYLEDFDPFTFAPLGTFSLSNTLFETKRDQAHWQNKYLFGDSGQTAFGVDYLNDKVESTNTYAENERDNKAIYALAQDKFGNNQVQISGRVDNNEAFGTHRTGNIAWSYDINSSIQTSLSHGTAFIAPTFNDLYFVDPFFNGNPNLDPETSRSTELGFSGNHQWGFWDIRAYQTKIENLIINVSTDPTNFLAPYTTINSDKAKINGLEAELSSELVGWNSNINVAFIDPTDERSGKVLQNRAKRTLKINASQSFRGHLVTISALAQSSRFSDVTNTTELGGYGILNIMVERPVDKHWTIKTRLENVLDKEYTTSTDFYGNTTNNTPISLFVTLSYLN